MAFARPPRVLLVVAPYYVDITEQLVLGAVTELQRAGATWDRVDVAGAFEIPAAISIAGSAASRPGSAYDGYIGLGCVIRGETSHYDHICTETARALQDLAVSRHYAIGFGVLTCENGEQARARASVEKKNKGGEAARACLSIIEVKQSFGLYPEQASG